LQACFEFYIILYDAIMDNSYFFFTVIMRVGIELVRRTMSCPAGMRYADVADQWLLLQDGLKGL